MPRRFAFSDSSQTCNGFTPFEALQPTQHKAMFSRVAMLISLTICSHERFVLLSELNWHPQYTQLVSRFITAVSTSSGIPQRLLKIKSIPILSWLYVLQTTFNLMTTLFWLVTDWAWIGCSIQNNTTEFDYVQTLEVSLFVLTRLLSISVYNPFQFWNSNRVTLSWWHHCKRY